MLLPNTVFDHELVRLHLRGASQTQHGLRRPFRSEPEKMTEMCAPLLRMHAHDAPCLRAALPAIIFFWRSRSGVLS